MPRKSRQVLSPPLRQIYKCKIHSLDQASAIEACPVAYLTDKIEAGKFYFLGQAHEMQNVPSSEVFAPLGINLFSSENLSSKHSAEGKIQARKTQQLDQALELQNVSPRRGNPRKEDPKTEEIKSN